MNIQQHTPPLHHWERWCRRVRPQQKPWRRRAPSSLTWSCWQRLAADAWTPVIALREGQRRDSGGKSKQSWHPEDRKRTGSAALGKPEPPSLPARKARAGGRASNRIIATAQSRQRNHDVDNMTRNNNSTDMNFQGEPRVTADTSLDDLRVSYRSSQQTLKPRSRRVICPAWPSLKGQFTKMTKKTEHKTSAIAAWIFSSMAKSIEIFWLFSLLINLPISSLVLHSVLGLLSYVAKKQQICIFEQLEEKIY